MQCDTKFGAFIFDDIIPHPSGDIPVRYLGDLPSGESAMMWGLQRGVSYPPETHAHGHTLTILTGKGIFFLAGKELPYMKGTTFEVRGNVPHAFFRIDETTVVVQLQPT